MQDLKEIILLLVQHKVFPFKGADARSKSLALWDGIVKGKFSTDEAAAKALYDESFEGSKYRKLKSEFRERVLNAVLEIDGNQKDYSDYQKAYYDCHRQWTMVRILTGQNANFAAVSIATRLLRQAEKFDFTLLAMDIASYLRVQYGLRESNDRKFWEAQEIFERHRKIYDAESLAESLYTTLIVRYVNNRSAQSDVSSLATEYWEQISPLVEQHATYKLQMYGYMIGLMRYTAANDHARALVVCNEAIQFLKAVRMNRGCHCKYFTINASFAISSYGSLRRVWNLQIIASKFCRKGRSTGSNIRSCICNCLYIPEGSSVPSPS